MYVNVLMYVNSLPEGSNKLQKSHHKISSHKSSFATEIYQFNSLQHA